MTVHAEAVCFFWHEMALYVGPAIDSAPHAQFCLELSLSLDGNLGVDLARGQGSRGLGGALVGSRVAHQQRFDGSRMAKLIVGPLTPEGTCLRSGLGSRSIRPISLAEVEPCRGRLLRLIEDRDPDRARSVARSLIERWSPTPAGESTDRRILGAMERLLHEFACNAPVAELARDAGLSESRFGHVFRNEVGIPVRTYRRWLRLRAGLILGLAGWDLAAAAHEAGFADQSDFSRACRGSFGMPPSKITQYPTAVIVGPPDPGDAWVASLGAARA